MKKILFVLSMLVSVAAYSQTTGFFRYDTVRFQKGGGNSEFFLENGTRNVTGGVLTNTGGGRTAFVTPAATTKAINGTTLSLSGDTVLLGGNVLNRYTVIPLNGFPLTINHNGVNNAARSDSNSLRLSNNTLATSSTDSLVSPALIFSTSGWKATPPTAASQNVQFILDALGKSGSGTANGLFRIGVRVNNAAAITNLYSVDRLGVWQQNFNIGGIIFGNGTGAGGVAIGGGNPLQLQTVSASGNMAIGSSALPALTGGMHNLAIGNNALLSSVNDTFNLAIGTNALGLNNGGDLNTAIGYRSMAFNTTGSQNVSLGANALTANTTGFKNNGIGAGALEENTTGSFNVANGPDALLHNLTGSNNVGVGWLAFGNNLTGDLNTVVGYNGFNGIVNGAQNVIIGASSTAANDTIDNAIGIGTGVVIPASNAIVIGRASNTTNYQFGIAAGAGTKALRYDPTTRQLFYSDTATGGGGGGSGTVTSVDPGYGLIGTPDPITTTGTVILDTTIAMNKAGAQVISGAKNFTASPTLSSHTATYLLYAGTGGLVSSTGNMYYDGARAVFGTTAQIGQGASSGEAAGGATYASIGADWVELRPSWLTGSSSAGLRALYFNGSAWQSALEYGFTSGGVATNMSLLKSGGKVGIGIAPASVTAKLHVVDNTVTTGNAALITSTSATSGAALSIDITGTAAAGDGSFAGTQAGARIKLSGTNATGSVVTFGANIDNAHAGTGSINYGTYVTTSNGVAGNTSGYFQASGTNAPNIAVDGNANGTGTAVNYGGRFNAAGGATNIAVLTTAGNSGFLVSGTPNSALHTTSFATAYRAITALRTLDVTDRTIHCTANTFTVTLPSSTTIIGREYIITNSGAGVITVATTGGETFLNVTTVPTTLTVNQFQCVTVQSTGGGWIRTSSL